jgi:hypothetical protein
LSAVQARPLGSRRGWLQFGAAASLLAVLRPAWPGPPPTFPFQAELLEEGIFQTPRNGHSTLQLVESTRTVVPQRGTTFGFRYRLSALPGKHVPGFAMRVIHPPIRNPGGGKPRTMRSVPHFIEAERGVAEGLIVFGVGEPAEVKPGRWTLQLLYRGGVVLAREFVLK